MGERRQLEEFIDIHKGETAWVFGKGPTLDLFDFADAGEIRCAINDVVGFVPECKYAFANDSVRPWVDMYRIEHILFTPRRTIKNDFLRPDWPDCQVCVYEDNYREDIWVVKQEKSELAKCLQIRSGTLGSVIQVLYLMGISKIVAVGIDGGQAHAERKRWRTRLRNDHWRDYNRIRDHFISAGEFLNIDLAFFKGPTIPHTNGKMKVRFTKNLFVKGVPYHDGETAYLTEPEAVEVLSCGCGVPVTDKAETREGIETAAIERGIEAPEIRKPARKYTRK